jgi:hypothetical protein
MTVHRRTCRPPGTGWRALLAIVVLAGCTTTASPSPSAVTPTPTPIDGVHCPVVEQTGILRSNTLVDLQIDSTALADRIVFRLGDPAPEPTGGTGRLRAVAPPFAQGGSGLPVEVEGTWFVELHLDGMLIADESGNPVFRGETSVAPNLPALRQVEMTEAFEGVYNFVIGYDGNGCVGLVDDESAKTLTITIGH